MGFDLKIEKFLFEPEKRRFYNLELFSFLAARYDSVVRVLSFGRDAKWKEILVDSLPSLSCPSCLDIGCGTGDLSFSVAHRFPRAKVTGLDLTPAMIKVAETKNKYSNVTLTVQDMCELGFKNESFDIVTAGYAVRNAPDLNKTLREIIRVLKPGGTFAILDFSKPTNKLLQGVEYSVLSLWGTFCGVIIYGNSGAFESIPKTLDRFPDDRELETILRKLHFQQIESRYFFLGITRLVLCRKAR